jgi:hypothetical protein
MELLDNIPANLELGKVLKQMRVRGENKAVARIVGELVELARPLVRPKAIYEVAYIEIQGEDSLDIGGVTFTSRLLRDKLDKVGRVFPFIITCGRELDSLANPDRDFMRNYCLDMIKEMALRSAVSYTENHLKETFAIDQLSRMNPGSLPSWPLTQQRELFSLFGDVKELIGVELTETFLMIPVKSVSGIFFPTEVKFESCQLCPREVCRGRRAPYDPELARRYQADTV